MRMHKTIRYALKLALASSISLNPATAGEGPARQGEGCQNLTLATLGHKAAPFGKPILSASEQYGVSKDLLKAVITIESCFKPKALGSAGERGLMQLKSGTARRFEVSDGYSVWQSIHGGARYLSYLLSHYQGDANRAISAYNAGEGNVPADGKIPNPYYVKKVLHAYGKFSKRHKEALFIPAKAFQPDPNVWKRIPAEGTATPDHPKRMASTYTVKAHDTIYEVMRQTGVHVSTLIQLNQLAEPYGIEVGQSLRLK